MRGQAGCSFFPGTLTVSSPAKRNPFRIPFTPFISRFFTVKIFLAF
jgi:hypothetical protein